MQSIDEEQRHLSAYSSQQMSYVATDIEFKQFSGRVTNINI